MNNKHLLIAALTLPLLLNVVVTNAEETQNIIVDPDFDFRTDRDMLLNLTNAPSGTGVINVYYDYEHHDMATNTYYPDPNTRVFHFKTTTVNQVKFQARKNWEFLIFEFVPTDPNGVEQYQKIQLSTASQIDLAM